MATRNAHEALETLMVLTEALLKEQPLERSLECVTQAALQLVDCDHASIRLLDSGGRQLLSGARSGVGRDHRPVELRPGEGLAGWVLEHGERARVDDVGADARFVGRDGQGFAIGSALVVPLFAPEMVVGVLGVSAKRVAAFDESDVVLVQLLANCCAPSILRSRLKHLAITDPQTRALNQGALMPRLELELSEARARGDRPSLLLMDLDHFKQVNDAHGHAAGDTVLVEFAERVRRSIRAGDVLVRRGGEEFVVILPQTASEAALFVAERIRTTLYEAPVELAGGQRLAQTVSIGVAIWDGQESAATLEQRADSAMYDAKHAGRNRTVVSEF